MVTFGRVLSTPVIQAPQFSGLLAIDGLDAQNAANITACLGG